jgi:hypothetical protein
MATHTVTLTIEVPDNFDDMWEGPHAGPQIAHDLLIANSMSGLLHLYAEASRSKEHDLAEYILAKFNIVNGIKIS